MSNDKSPTGFGSGQLAFIYPHRLYSLAAATRDNCDRLFQLAPASTTPTEGYIKVDPATMALIESILLSAANMRKLLHPPKERGSKESAAAFRARERRTKSLSDMVEGLSTTEIRNTQARNALEHLDEKLDEIIANVAAGTKRYGAYVPFNLILSSGEILDQFGLPDQYPLLIYDALRRLFKVMTYQVDLGRLREEASAIAERVKPKVTIPGDEQPGGMIMFLEAPK